MIWKDAHFAWEVDFLAHSIRIPDPVIDSLTSIHIIIIIVA